MGRQAWLRVFLGNIWGYFGVTLNDGDSALHQWVVLSSHYGDTNCLDVIRLMKWRTWVIMPRNVMLYSLGSNSGS